MNPNDTFDPRRVAWISDDADFENFLEAIRGSLEVVYDLETTGLDEWAVTNGRSNGGVAARVSMASFTLPTTHSGEPTTWLLPLSHPDSVWSGHWRAMLRRTAFALVEAGHGLIGHNVKYDCRWVHATTGVNLAHLISWDTQISSHLLDENRSTKLKERAPDTFKIDRWDDHDLTYPGASEDVPLIELGLYAARDTYWTWKLAVNHRRRMFLIDSDEPEGFEEIEDARLGLLAVNVAMPTTATLTTIEQRGMGLDGSWVREQLAEHQRAYKALFGGLATLYEPQGLSSAAASFAPTSNWFQEWAQNAVDAGDLRVTAMTKGGKPQWSKSVLKRQAREQASDSVAARLLALRDHGKKAEFLQSWLDKQAPNGNIYSTYNAGSVVTGRLSSSGPNMQQVTYALRQAFKPRDGYVLVDLDYGQIEMRVAAFISRSETMMQAFQEGADLHSMLAARITAKALSQVTPRDRQSGKSANFGLLYGMSPDGFREYADDAYGVIFSQEEAEKVHAAFFAMWQGLRDWHINTVARAHREGQVTSPIGRVRRLPGIHDKNERQVSYSERSSINSPVQGMASDLMQIAAASIEGLLPGHDKLENVYIVGTVHDSILAEIPAEGWRGYAEACRDRMVQVTGVLWALGCDFDVPLAADASVGSRWSLTDVGELE